MAVIQGRRKYEISGDIAWAMVHFAKAPVLALSRLLVRVLLAVVLFAVAVSALVIVSLAAMYSDHRVTQ